MLECVPCAEVSLGVSVDVQCEMFPKVRNGKEGQISRVGTWFKWMCWVELLGVGWKYFEFRPKSGRIAIKYRFVINLSTFYYQNASTPPMNPGSCFPMCPLTFSLLLATTCYRRWRILYGFFIRIELLPSARSNASPGRFILNNWIFIGLESVPNCAFVFRRNSLFGRLLTST
jgi:hypothetical protein